MIAKAYRAVRRYINTIPFPYTTKHFYSFYPLDSELKDNEVSSPESWDTLRTRHPHFEVSSERDTWLESLRAFKDGQDAALQSRAIEIASLARQRNITDIFSVGVGTAALEFFIKAQLPSTRMTISDYNEIGIERLRSVFTECDDVRLCDMEQKDWSAMGGGSSRCALVLMYRVDTNFTNRRWRVIFENMAQSRVRNILYVPADIITLRSLLRMGKRNLRWRLRGRTPSFAGYIRNAKVYPKLWKDLYSSEEMLLSQMPSFWLSLID